MNINRRFFVLIINVDHRIANSNVIFLSLFFDITKIGVLQRK